MKNKIVFIGLLLAILTSCSTDKEPTGFEIIILVLSIVLFIISMGSVNNHKARNSDIEYAGVCSDMNLPKSFSYNSVLSFFTLLIFTMLFISVNTLFDLKWYWNLLIAFAISGFRDVFSLVYRLKFGYSSKSYPSLLGSGVRRCNMPLIDALITFILGIILYLISII